MEKKICFYISQIFLLRMIELHIFFHLSSYNIDINQLKIEEDVTNFVGCVNKKGNYVDAPLVAPIIRGWTQLC